MRPSEQLRFWAHELAAMARTGLAFAENEYDRDRFERTLAIAEGIAALTHRAMLRDASSACVVPGCR